MQVIYQTLAALVSHVEAGDARTAFLVQYRGKDSFCLAESAEEAVSAVAEAAGYQVGHVPLNLIVEAARGTRSVSRPAAPAAPAAAPAEAPAEAPTGAAAPDLRPISDVVMGGMMKPDLLQAARDRGLIVDTTMKKVDLINLLREHREMSDEGEEEEDPGDSTEAQAKKTF